MTTLRDALAEAMGMEDEQQRDLLLDAWLSHPAMAAIEAVVEAAVDYDKDCTQYRADVVHAVDALRAAKGEPG